jgi:predicted aspartyl protease
MFVFVACSNISKNDPITDRYLSDLLANKNYFKLRTELSNTKEKLSEDRFLYYKANCDDVFNDCLSSDQGVETLLTKYKKQLNDSIVSDLLAIKIRNHIRMFRYQEVAATCYLLLEQYGSVLDSAKTADYKNAQQMYEKLSSVKPTRIHKQDDVEIASYRNPFINLLMIPVKSGGIRENFMFDTGADMSVVTMSYAEKMGMTIYETDTHVKTSTSHSVQVNIAVADSLYIGDILFENVVFLVMPLFSIPEIDLYIRGIIGANEMRQLDEIHVRKDGSIFIPKISQEKQLHNMYLGGLEGLSPIVQLQSSNDTLMLTFDTGANVTSLSKKYYDNHKEKVDKNGKLGSISNTGVGGSEDKRIYTLKDFSYAIGTKNNVLHEIDVELIDEDFDGNIGQDMIIPFEKMILNFQYMYIDFE